MKKISSFLVIALLVVLSVPSVPALADEPVDVKCYTTESVSDYFSGSVGETDKQDIADLIYRVPNTFVTSDIISALQNFPSDPNNGNSSPLTSGYWFVTVNSSLNQMAVYWPLESFNDVDIDWSSASPCLTVNTNGEVCFNACFTETDSNARYYMMISYYNLSTHTWGSPTGYTMTQTNDSDHIFYFKIYNTYGTGRPNFILSASDNLHYLYSSTEYQYFTNTSGTVNHTDFLLSIYKNLYNYTNYLSASLPYYDGENIVVPDDGLNEESNENHMYFNSCDFGFCEPYNVNNFTNFGGAYFYVKYNVDDWVLNHIGDYKIEFHVDCYVGNEHFPFTTRVSLDPDLVLTIPFSYFDGFNYGFSTYITDQKIDKSFLKTYLYCIKPDQYISFYDKLNSVQSNESLHSMLNELADNDLDFPFIFCYTNSLSTTLISDSILTTPFLNSLYYNNRFNITCNARLIDESGNESGWVSREFDLVRGSSLSTNNDGLTNENPFNDDSSEYLPDIPDYEVVETGKNNSNGVSVYNMTPDQIKMTIDNGLKDFVTWYNTDTSVGNTAHSFWNNMGIFKDNPASSLYEQYFGFLPADFKDLIFGACGIGIVGGAFCILRKKLT